MILAGYDPYGGSGALAKLSMVSGRAALLSPTFDDLTDPPSSFAARQVSMFSTLTLACAQSALTGFCGADKAFVHPNFPSTAPF